MIIILLSMIDNLYTETSVMDRWPARDELVLKMLEHIKKNKANWTEEEEQTYRDSILDLYENKWNTT